MENLPTFSSVSNLIHYSARGDIKPHKKKHPKAFRKPALICSSMVQIFNSSQFYDFDFRTTSVAYLNRYPNPYAKHVLSSDTLECFVDPQGRLHTTRLVVKRGLLPDFIKPILGKSLDSWVIEKSIIDRDLQKVLAYSTNVDHRRFVKVQEFLTYDCSSGLTNLKVNVRFSSTFFGLKRKIEKWSRERFTRNLLDHRDGFMYVMNKFKGTPESASTLSA